MLVLIQRIEPVHLRLRQAEVEDVAVGNDALFGVGLGQGDEPGDGSQSAYQAL